MNKQKKKMLLHLVAHVLRLKIIMLTPPRTATLPWWMGVSALMILGDMLLWAVFAPGKVNQGKLVLGQEPNKVWLKAFNDIE